MEVWVIVLFLAGQKIEPEYDFKDLDACKSYGKAVVESYKKYHKVSTAWFWCYREQKA